MAHAERDAGVLKGEQPRRMQLRLPNAEFSCAAAGQRDSEPYRRHSAESEDHHGVNCNEMII